MKEIRFPSLLNSDKYGYIFDDMYPGRKANSHVGMGSLYETYGHGNVQHSGEVPLTWELYNDFCISLAKYITDNLHDEDIQLLGSFTKYKRIAPTALTSIHKIYLHGKDVAYVENCKDKWYHTRELAISSSPSKAKLRDWERIHQYMGVSPLNTAFRVVSRLGCNDNMFIHLRDIERVHEQFAEQDLDVWEERKTYLSSFGNVPGITVNMEYGEHQYREATLTLDTAINAAVAADTARRWREHAILNHERRKETATT